MKEQEQLIEILKHKGIGPQGSKSLSNEDISNLPFLLYNKECSLITKSTILTALLLLDKNENEEELVKKLNQEIDEIPVELHFLLTKISSNDFQRILLRLIEKQDLTYIDAKQASLLLLDNDTPGYLQASFLEALRLKRETDEENKAFYQYFLNQIDPIIIDCDPIIELGDSFDGVNRNNNYNLFTACLLGTLGYTTTICGNYTVAPKFGITHHQVLEKANKNPRLSRKEILDQLEENNWVYVDQSIFHSQLWDKAQLRTEMVKRPFLATFEKILSPIVSTEGNMIATSYTHAHYKNANIEILKSNPNCKIALNIKGLEGTIQPKHNIKTLIVKLENGKSEELNYAFSDETLLDTSLVSAEETLKQGLDFITNNTNNQAKQYVCNTTIMLLKSFGLMNSETEIYSEIEKAIVSGEVLENWNASL